MRRAVTRMTAAFATVAALAFLGGASTLGGCSEDELLFPEEGPTLADRIEPAPGGMRRLLARQYVNSVWAIFGDAAGAVAAPPDDSALHGFATIGNAYIALDPASVEQYETSALAIASAVVDDPAAFATFMPCTPSSATDRACYEQVIRRTGRLAWRRNLTDDEVVAITNLASDAGADMKLGLARDGVRFIILALLTSPDFLYMVEVGEPDPNNPARRWLTAPELVTRMSFFLTDTTPSAGMLDRAEAGELGTPEALRAFATELVHLPAAPMVTRMFFDELYGLGKLPTLTKDTATFPDWTPEVAQAARDSVQQMLTDIIWGRDTDVRELLNADYAYVNEDLAPIYGVSVAGQDLVKLPLPPAQHRVGLLGQAAFLALQGKATRESAVKRGLFVRRALMCDDIPPPPPEVTPDLPDFDPNDPLTMKERLSKHQEVESCATCHAMTDPVGYPLQIFDGIGKFRDTENGLPIDPSGESPGIGAFADIHELAQLLSENQQVPSCLIRNFYRHSIGQLETRGQEPAITEVSRAFTADGYRVQNMLVEIASSPAFQMVGEPK